MSTGAHRAEGLRAILGPRVRRPWRLALRVVLGVALGAAVLALVLRGANYGDVRATLAGTETAWLGCAAAAVLGTTAAKIGRWKHLFPKGQRPRTYPLGRALLVGQLANFLLPLRAGDLGRAYIIQAERVSGGATALATIATEKIYDVLFLLVLTGVAAILTPLPTWLATPLGVLAAAGLVVLALVTGLEPARVLAWIRPLCDRLPLGLGRRLEDLTRDGLAGLAALREPQMALTACIWSTLIWILAASTNLLVFRALGLSLGLDAALLQVLVHLIPLPIDAPGRIGIHQGLTSAGLAPYALHEASEVAYAAVLYAVVFAPQVVLGAISLALTVLIGRRQKQR